LGLSLDKLSDTLTTDEVNKQIQLVLGDKGFNTIEDLIEWFEDGRAHLVASPKSAALELGTTSAFMHAIVASEVFRRAYFSRMMTASIPPHKIARGMELLANDFVNPSVAVKERLAIFRVIRELFGFEPTQRVKHDITTTQRRVELRVVASPSDFVDKPEQVSADLLEPGDGEGRVDEGDEGDAGMVLEASFEETEEKYT